MTAGRKVHSASQHWCTPPKYVVAVTAVLGKIGLDPCSNEQSVVCAEQTYSLPQDGLVMPWRARTIFVNPPYGKDTEHNKNLGRPATIADWLRRCACAAQSGSEVISLIPVAPNTRHWKESIWPSASAIAFLYDTRLRFLVNGSTDNKGAPMACCVVYWGHNAARFDYVFKEHGKVVHLK